MMIITKDIFNDIIRNITCHLFS